MEMAFIPLLPLLCVYSRQRRFLEFPSFFLVLIDFLSTLASDTLKLSSEHKSRNKRLVIGLYESSSSI